MASAVVGYIYRRELPKLQQLILVRPGEQGAISAVLTTFMGHVVLKAAGFQ